MIKKQSQSSTAYFPIPGSRVRLEYHTRKVIGPTRPEGFTSMQVWVRSRATPAELDHAFNRLAQQSIKQRKYLTHDQLAARFGADPKDMDKIEEYAARFKLVVRRRDPGMQMLELWGRRSDFSQAFKIKWVKYRKDGPNGLPLGRVGEIFVPQQLQAIITRMSDFNDAHSSLTRIRSRGENQSKARVIPDRLPKDLTQAIWTGKLLMQHYQFPDRVGRQNLDGAGQTIALIELGQGYLPSDVQKYFGELGIEPPTIIAAGNHMAKNSWQSNKGEVITDIDVVGAVAPKARLVVYFGERETAEELFNVVSMAVLDRERKPSIISISWGWPEFEIPPALMSAMSDLFKKAALLGITICVASGDNGSLDLNPRSIAAQKNEGRLNVDFPACLEASLACGGTWIIPAGEHVWNMGNGWASGGGVSHLIARPAYQKHAGVPRSRDENFSGRGVPDVAGIAVNHAVITRGKPKVSHGTSFVAPMWAGMIARLNQAIGKRVGLIHPILYANPHTCKSITHGHNDIQRKRTPFFYPADRGWDAATGLGVPRGRELVRVIRENAR